MLGNMGCISFWRHKRKTSPFSIVFLMQIVFEEFEKYSRHFIQIDSPNDFPEKICCCCLLLWSLYSKAKWHLSHAFSLENCPLFSAVLAVAYELPGAGIVFIEFRHHKFPEELYHSFFESSRWAEINQVVYFVGQSRCAEDEFFSHFFCPSLWQFEQFIRSWWHILCL